MFCFSFLTNKKETNICGFNWMFFFMGFKNGGFTIDWLFLKWVNYMNRTSCICQNALLVLIFKNYLEPPIVCLKLARFFTDMLFSGLDFSGMSSVVVIEKYEWHVVVFGSDGWRLTMVIKWWLPELRKKMRRYIIVALVGFIASDTNE